MTSASGFISSYVARTRGGVGSGLIVTLQYACAGRPPSLRKLVGMAKVVVLGETLDWLEEGKSVDLGFTEDACRRVRTDKTET